MKILFWLLLLANLSFFAYTQLDRVNQGESARLAQQIQPDKLRVLSPQQVAALGPTKMAALNDVCLEWGPFADADKPRALSALEPLDLNRLLTQKRVDTVTNFWVYLPPFPSRAAADKRAGELRALGVDDLYVMDSGPQRLAISLGLFHTEDAAKARLAAVEAKGVTSAKVGPRAQSAQETSIVIRDPPANAVARVHELASDFPGAEVKTGSCDRAA
jgi:hypothetical protein